jgi:tellurite resistance protein
MRRTNVERDDFTNAARTLEEAFFAKENARLLQQMRERAKQQERRTTMREVVRVDDDALIDHLIALGLEPETVLALQLVPLAAIAWADGRIEPRERDAVLKAAAAKGLAPDSLAGQMLDRWLMHQPGAELVDAWKRQMRALWPSLSPKERDEIRASALERARSVAEATGGFLGLTSRISPEEKAVLDDLAQVLAD